MSRLRTCCARGRSSSGALSSLAAFVAEPAHTTELVVLIAATGGGMLRFALLRSWVFKIA